MVELLLIVTGVGTLLVGLALQKPLPRLRNVASGLLISYVFILLIFVAGELYLRCCYIENDNLPLLVNQNWMDRYFHRNSLGFRDREWTPDEWEGKTTVLVVGDSFTAGLGIRDPADRFSDVLAAHLGDHYAVMNLGVWGTSTTQQLQILQDYPLQNPDVIIWQYFLNDMDYTQLKLGILPEAPTVPRLAQESYLLNLLYWRLFLPTEIVAVDGTVYASWWDWTYATYDNSAVWEVHRQEIEEAIDYVESTGARLIVVIFPNLTQVVQSIAYVDRVAQVFEERGHHEILKLFDEAATWQTHDLIASSHDTHPSARFSRRVGDLLYEEFFANAPVKNR